MNDLKKNLKKCKIEKNSIAEKTGKEKNGKDKTGHSRKDNSVNVLKPDRSDTKRHWGHWLRFAGCMLVTAVIVAAGMIIPDRLLSVKRAMLYNNQEAVAADDIEPFGEAYNSTKNRLLSVIRFQNERDTHDIDVVCVDRNDKSNGIDGTALYQNGIEKLSRFFDKIDGVSFNEDNIEFVTVIKADNRDIYEMEIDMYGGSDGMYAASDMYIASDVDSGFPITCTMFFTQYMDLAELWKAVLSAYRDTMGIDWTDVTDYTAAGYDDGFIGYKGNDSGEYYDNVSGMASDGYDSIEFYSFRAISTDGVFMLMGQIEGMGDGGYSFAFRLTERY